MNIKFKISPLFFLLLIFFFICSESLYAQNDQDEQDNQEEIIRVSKLKIKGNDAIETKEIRKSIETLSPSIKPWVKKPEFDLDVFKDDIQRIKELFANNGYYDAVVEYSLKYNDTGKRVKILITIVQGEPVILRELNIVLQVSPEVEGESELYAEIKEEIIKKVPLASLEDFSPNKFEQAKTEINIIMSNEGYPKHELKSEALVNRSEKWADVNFTIIPGEKYTFGSIEIIGNEKIPTYLVRRAIIFNPNDVYSLEKVSESQTRIFQLGVFKSVIISQIYNDDDLEVDTVITVVDRKLGNLKFGVGFGTVDRIRGQIEWTQRNFLGGGRNLNVLTKASFITQFIQASLTQPFVIGRDSELTGLVNVQRDDLPSYEGTSVVTSLTLSKSLKRALWANGSFNVIYSRINSQATRTPIEQSRENVFLTTFGAGLNYNTTDNIFDPKKGVFADQNFESAFKLFGSQVNYLLSLTDIRAYKEIKKDLVIAKRIQFGMLFPFGSTGEFDVPIFKRFFAGGPNSMRGFPFQRLGPLDSNQDPLGGNSLLVGNLELRYPLYSDFGGVVFLDYGNVFPGTFSYPLDKLKYAVGSGIRYNTIIGPIRLDVGYTLNPEPGLDRLQVFISVGQAF